MRTLGRTVLAAQPFSELLGTLLEELRPGYAALRLAISPALLQQDGVAHGGVLAYLADNVISFAAGSVLGLAVVTAEVKVNYLRPARGRELVATASVVQAGRSSATCRCEILAIDERGDSVLCAVALGSVVRKSSET